MNTDATHAQKPNDSTGSRSQSLPPVEKSEPAGSQNQSANSQQQGTQAALAKELQEQKLINELKSRDREVRAHEAAHAAIGGQYAGAPTYTYQRGPNGVQYAVAGQVSISTSPVAGDPKATLDKAQQIQRAALAPSEPSTQDRKVAAQASQMAQQARIDLARLEQEQNKAGTDGDAQASETATSPQSQAFIRHVKDLSIGALIDLQA